MSAAHEASQMSHSDEASIGSWTPRASWQETSDEDVPTTTSVPERRETLKGNELLSTLIEGSPTSSTKPVHERRTSLYKKQKEGRKRHRSRMGSMLATEEKLSIAEAEASGGSNQHGQSDGLYGPFIPRHEMLVLFPKVPEPPT